MTGATDGYYLAASTGRGPLLAASGDGTVVTLVFALGFIIVNLLTDLLYAVVDPRLRS